MKVGNGCAYKYMGILVLKYWFKQKERDEYNRRFRFH